MRMIRTGIAGLLVTAGGLAIPGSAEAYCGVAFTAFAVYRQGVEVIASADAQVVESEPDACWGVQYIEFPLEIELQTPQDVLYDSDLGYGYDWEDAQASVMVSVEIASYQGGGGWYDAIAFIREVEWLNPGPGGDYGPWYADCYSQCDVYVPSFVLELDGPTSTQQYSGVYIYASLEPSFLVGEIEWQGCTPTQQDNSECFYDAAGTGPHVVTASLDGGPSDQWTVNVSP